MMFAFIEQPIESKIIDFSSKEVFAERKQGNIQKAYKMAQQLVQHNPKDSWNHKALAWCLIDLIKQNPQEQYIEQLKQIPISARDDILEKSINFAIKKSNPLNTEINHAKMLSKKKQHREAANLYFKLLKNQPENMELQTSFAWELYYLTSENLKKKSINIDNIKRYFLEYFKLQTEKPSLLHHCFLRASLKLITNEEIDKKNNIDFAKFCQQWNLENLNPDDYEPSSYQTQSGEIYKSQSLALSVFRAALKNAMELNNLQALNELVAFIQTKIHFIKSDHIWLQWDLAKSYHLLGNNKVALDILLPILKSKPNEYWLWDFLGDLYFYDDNELAISCYCKALLHQKDINFVAKIKMKLAYYFIHYEKFERAKIELQAIIDYKQKHSQKISEELQQLSREIWFEKPITARNNLDFYSEKASTAEELLYQDLPWIAAVLGDAFEHNDKISRKLFIKTEAIPMEISVPDSRISLKTKNAGLPIQIKGEWNNNKFQIYLVKIRQALYANDIFSLFPAVVDHINTEKRCIHLLINEKIDTTIAQTTLPFIPNLYDVVNVHISQHTTKDGKLRYKVYHIEPNEDLSDARHLIRSFKEKVRISNGLGFGYESDLFFPPEIVQNFKLTSNDLVCGRALKSYNKKKNSWGWRVIDISLIEKNASSNSFYDE